MDVSESGNTEIVQLLLDNNASINLKSKDKGTALKFASKNGYKEIATLLKQAGSTV